MTAQSKKKPTLRQARDCTACGNTLATVQVDHAIDCPACGTVTTVARRSLHAINSETELIYCKHCHTLSEPWQTFGSTCRICASPYTVRYNRGEL